MRADRTLVPVSELTIAQFVAGPSARIVAAPEHPAGRAAAFDVDRGRPPECDAGRGPARRVHTYAAVGLRPGAPLLRSTNALCDTDDVPQELQYL